MCRECAHGCADCSDGECHQCKSDFYGFWDFDLCVMAESIPATYFLSDSPVGYAKLAPSSDQSLYSINLSHERAEELYQIYVDYSDWDETFWSFEIRSGGLEDGYDRHDFFHLPSRGSWFDGRYNYIEQSGMMPPTYTMSYWLKPYNSGTLFSNSATYDEHAQQVIYIGIRNQRIEFEYSYGGVFGFKQNNVETGRNLKFYSSTDSDVVTLKAWQQLAVSFTAEGTGTDIVYWVNHEKVDIDNFHGYLVHYDNGNDTFPSRYLFAAQERDDRLTNMYRGFIYSIDTYNYTPEWPQDCDCISCPAAYCLGACEWNEFQTEAGCQRCPDHCREGCWDDGTCPVPTHEAFP